MLPTFNEARVLDRLLERCTSFTYPRYEVLLADDSTDSVCLASLKRWEEHPKVRVLRRDSRLGWKAGALNLALEKMDGRTTHILVLDADFTPEGTLIERMLDRFSDERTAAVVGYQDHSLNADENWVTKAVHLFSTAGYRVEMAARAALRTMLQVTGSVIMVRADVLREFRWEPCITEDWELTLRLYLNGYKIRYDESLRVPAECPSTVKRALRQQVRWSLGHMQVVRRYLVDVLRSPCMSTREKVEFLSLGTYYGQSIFIILGSALSVLWLLGASSSMAASGFLALLGIGLYGLSLLTWFTTALFLEGSLRETAWIPYAILLGLVAAPFAAWGTLKGLGGRGSYWHRTYKTGRVTRPT
ncbi:MAG: glycosyltransferase family 2 protein, partial [Candidatus Bathyarchaeia archaeon]